MVWYGATVPRGKPIFSRWGGGADFENTLRFFSDFLQVCATITTTTIINAESPDHTTIQPVPRARIRAPIRARSLNKVEVSNRYKSTGARDTAPSILIYT